MSLFSKKKFFAYLLFFATSVLAVSCDQRANRLRAQVGGDPERDKTVNSKTKEEEPGNAKGINPISLRMSLEALEIPRAVYAYLRLISLEEAQRPKSYKIATKKDDPTHKVILNIEKEDTESVLQFESNSEQTALIEYTEATGPLKFSQGIMKLSEVLRVRKKGESSNRLRIERAWTFEINKASEDLIEVAGKIEAITVNRFSSSQSESSQYSARGQISFKIKLNKNQLDQVAILDLKHDLSLNSGTAAILKPILVINDEKPVILQTQIGEEEVCLDLQSGEVALGDIKKEIQANIESNMLKSSEWNFKLSGCPLHSNIDFAKWMLNDLKKLKKNNSDKEKKGATISSPVAPE